MQILPQEVPFQFVQKNKKRVMIWRKNLASGTLSIKLIFDLSIFQTVHPDCKIKNQVKVLDIGTISAILDKSLENRKTYLPLANAIINSHISTFVDWESFIKKEIKLCC